MAAPTGRSLRTEMFRHHTGLQTVTIHATIASATEIDIRGFSYGSVSAASTIASTTLTYMGCHTSGGTFGTLSNAAGTALTSTLDGASAEVIEIPAQVFSCPFIKIKGNADDGETVTVWLTS